MSPLEYEKMAALEGDHWWYRGLRDLIARTVSRLPPELREAPRVLDAGCGTGENLRLLQELLRPAYLGGFDLSPIATSLASRKAPQADVYVSNICDPAIRSDHLDLVLSCDVLYVPGLEAARPGLRRIVSHLVPGGFLVLNLPAYNWLLSDHDRAVDTTERFTARQVRSLLGDLGLSIECVTYRLCALFPAVVVSRLPSMLRPARQPRSDIDLPSRLVNSALWYALRAENRAIQMGIRFPWGSSVFAIGRKPAPHGSECPTR